MIKLVNILKEIRILSTKHFPKNRDWLYKVNNLEEAKNVFRQLDELGYKWASGRNINDYSGVFDSPKKYPIYIGFMLSREGIVFSVGNRAEDDLTRNYENPLKINF